MQSYSSVSSSSLHLNVLRFVDVVYVLSHRYKIILTDKIHPADEKQSCSDLLTLRDKAKKEWQLGKTKVERAYMYMQTSHTCPDLFLSL